MKLQDKRMILLVYYRKKKIWLMHNLEHFNNSLYQLKYILEIIKNASFFIFIFIKIQQ